jgi:hypoxanthine-DNA glycosylase
MEMSVVFSCRGRKLGGIAMRVHSFDPISDAASRVLVLGSMPGKASLRAGQYYAHPQNAFWKILGALFDFGPASPYESRIASLREHGIALWDVMQSCVRETSLDSDIEASSIVSNPFADFLRDHPEIHTICFNGAKAEASWRKHVLPKLPRTGDISYHRLPSTSPANASIRYDDKFKAWRILHRSVCARTPRALVSLVTAESLEGQRE